MLLIVKHFYLSLLTSLHFSKNRSFIKQLKNFFIIFYIKFFCAFNFFRGKKKNIYKDYHSINQENLFINEIELKKIIKKLDNLGFYENVFLNKETVNKIIKTVTKNNLSFFSKGKENNFLTFLGVLNENDNLEIIKNKGLENKISHIASIIKLNECQIIKELIKSNLFLNVAKNYIGSNKLEVTAECYISNPFLINEDQKKDNAQYYHYDLDYKRFLKIFLYLTDVNEESGPHIFIEGTHKKKKIKHILSERISDIEIKENYDDKLKKIILGEKGKVIFEDTFGLHKGLSPKNKSRIMIVIQYGKGLGINKFNQIYV